MATTVSERESCPAMADGSGTASAVQNSSALMNGARVGDALVRFGRGSVETLTRGVLSLVHSGKRQKVPEIMNPLLLESAVSIAAKIRRAEVSSVDVVKAYIQRMSEVNVIINAVVDRRFTEALEEANQVDELVSSGVKTEEQLERDTPFLGVPFTAKEAALIQGLSSTCGLVCRKGLKAEQDCDVVHLLRKAGAIPLAVTNTSEICMWWETYNKLHGQTCNPYDTTRTVGGSSGGEAALIASAGSLIGLGTDLGGSIRLPAFFTGIFGHKPSAGLVPHGGQFPPALEEITPYVVSGPMARYASDLRPLLKVLIGVEASSQLQLDIPVNLQAIQVYYMLDDGQAARTPVDPEIRTAMQKVVCWLKDRGVHVEEVSIKNLKYGFMIWCSYLSKVKDQRIAGLMAGNLKENDDIDPLRQEIWKWISGKSDHTFPIILNACVQDHIAPMLKKPLEIFLKRGEQLKQEMESLLSDNAVFLCPTFPTPAEHHGQMIVNPMNVGYSVVFNAISLPVTQCALGLTASGLPVGMQVVTAHGNDRLSLAFAEEIEKRFGGWMRPS